ncbi:hypothetical protein ACLB1Q_14385 [Escherichia coli]
MKAAMTLYEQMQAAGKTAADIEKVTIRTHEACIRIIDKKGPLNNPADRDHCISGLHGGDPTAVRALNGGRLRRRRSAR